MTRVHADGTATDERTDGQECKASAHNNDDASADDGDRRDAETSFSLCRRRPTTLRSSPLAHVKFRVAEARLRNGLPQANPTLSTGFIYAQTNRRRAEEIKKELLHGALHEAVGDCRGAAVMWVYHTEPV